MIILAGAGPGNPDLLTFETRRAIENAPRIIAFGRIKQSLEGIRKDIIEVSRTDELLEILKDEKDTLILASGDSNFFGVSELLMRKGIWIDKILPGISTVQYFASVLKISTSDCEVKSFHGREIDFSGLHGKKFFFFTDRKNTPSEISKSLSEHGLSGDLYAGYNLSYEDEEIVKVKIGETVKDSGKISSVMVVLNENIER